MKGRKNAYTCNTCLGSIVTVDADEGVTPMFLPCKANDGCGGRMVSHMYRIDQDLHATWEWFRPMTHPGMPDAYREYVRKGGLSLRPRRLA